jgi:glucosylceramidase
MRLLMFMLPLCAMLAVLTSCEDKSIPVPPIPIDTDTTGVVQVWHTNREGTLLLAKESKKLPLSTGQNADVAITVNPDITQQTMVGFGAAVTGSSAYALMTHLSATQRGSILRQLFDPAEGAGINCIRLTVGASDFSLNSFTYNDLPPNQTDEDLSEFSIEREQEHLIPLLKEIRQIAPDIYIMASPWTAPAWMKDNQSLLDGGQLLSNYYGVYAQYWVKYLQSMAQEGIPIQGITMQNEPLHQASYPTMRMAAEAQKVFLRDHLGPALNAAGLLPTTQVILYDHNWDNTDYALSILADPVAKQYAAGTAFHCYAGDVSAMNTVQQAHPDKGIYFTECSGGDFAPDFASNLSWNTENLIIGAPRAWAKTVLFWNLALDQNNGPKNGGCQDCRGVVTVNSTTGSITKNVEYYLLAHAARFVRKGAVRLSSPNSRSQGISQVAYRNLDGSIAILAFNHTNTPLKVRFTLGSESFLYELKGGSLVTFTRPAP